jgi:transcriptional regulator with XRE-family HTH domain
MFTNLKLLLWRSGVHQNRIAQATQMDEAVLSRIINGYREPTADQRNRIARYLNADENWLFARDVDLIRKRSPQRNSLGEPLKREGGN